MQTVIVIGGEASWQEHFPGVEVVQRRIQSARW